MADEKTNPCKARPFVIKIFCTDGDPNGIRVINKSNWSGQGLVVPRTSFPDAKSNRDYESMFNKPGVYVLVGHFDDDDNEDDAIENLNGNSAEDDDKKEIYVGEGDPVLDRLERHYSSKDKDFWNWCIFFVGEDLNKAHIQYLEASLYKYAKDAKKAKLNNENAPTPPNLSLAEKAVADGFLAEMMSIFPIVDLNVFQELISKNLLYIDKGSEYISARGFETPDGFVVLEGSTASLFEAPGIPPSLNKCRKIEKRPNCFEFVQDHPFRTPARAAGVILGKKAARSFWENKKDIVLTDIQKEEISEKGSGSENC
jgi:hypothetical protein